MYVVYTRVDGIPPGAYKSNKSGPGVSKFYFFRKIRRPRGRGGKNVGFATVRDRTRAGEIVENITPRKRYADYA